MTDMSTPRSRTEPTVISTILATLRNPKASRQGAAVFLFLNAIVGLVEFVVSGTMIEGWRAPVQIAMFTLNAVLGALLVSRFGERLRVIVILWVVAAAVTLGALAPTGVGLMGQTGLGLAILALLLGAGREIPTLAGLVLGAVSGSALMGSLGVTFVTGLMASTLIAATPIALGAYSGIFCERAGVVNIAIEGMMLTGALVGQLVATYTRSLLLGAIAGILAGGLMGALHAVLCIRFKADQIISGTVINIAAAGITGHIYQRYLVPTALEKAIGTTAGVGTFPVIRIPFLKEIPILGRVLFENQPVVLAMLALTFIIHYVMFNTPWGLRTRAVGEHPKAADTLGINVYLMRYVNVIVGGLVAGLGGIWFTLEWVGTFNIGMTVGKGFIGLAAMIFGKWRPFGSFFAANIFGFFLALQIRGQAAGSQIPYQFLSMAPYLATMIVLAGIIGRAIPPKADGIPYEK